MSLAAAIQITDQDTRTVVSSPGGAALGQVAQTSDGRTYRYALNGGVALDPGKLVVAADLVSNHTNKAVAAAVSVGGQVVTVTMGATAVTSDQYAGGYLTVNDAAGEGISYLIQGNIASDASAVATFYLQEQVTVALTTSSEVTAQVSPFSGVIISLTDQANLPVGVPNVTVAIANYAWVQTGGIVSVLQDASSITQGAEVTISAATGGAVGLKDAAGEAKVGVAVIANTSTEYQPTYLTLA